MACLSSLKQSDWNAFLQYRALEMQPSARLVVIASGADTQGTAAQRV